TDVYLLLGMVHELVAQDLVRPVAYVNGVDEVRTLVSAFPPEAVAPRCGVDADTIRELTAELAQARRAAVYGRIGTTTVEHGTVASWPVDGLHGATRNLARPRGASTPRSRAWTSWCRSTRT